MSELPNNVSSWITTSEAAALLGISESKVRRLVEERVLISARADGKTVIPAEIISDGQVLSSLRGTLFVLSDAGFSDAESLQWLYADNEELDTTPMNALLQGRKSAVRQAAQSLGF